jgi:hypothetical protein
VRDRMRLVAGETAWMFKTLIAAGVLASAFYAGVFLSSDVFQPQAVAVMKPVVECKLVERHTVRYVERPVAVLQNNREVRKTTADLRNFHNLEELEQWLAAVEANTTTVYFQLPGAAVDCDDYALDLQLKALTDGFIISFEIVDRGEYEKLFKNELPSSQSLHAINLAIIDNSAYYIEPQTSEVVLAAYLD